MSTENGILDDYYARAVPFATLENAGKSVHYSVPSRHTLWRARTLETKEPETLAWIPGFDSSAILVDIGANVGMYTIWAPVMAGVRVFAFEPEALNYAVLNQNIELNDLHDRGTAYCAALSDATGVGEPFVSELLAGGSNFSSQSASHRRTSTLVASLRSFLAVRALCRATSPPHPTLSSLKAGEEIREMCG
jgi:FkbM family methyltransferase